MTNYMGVFVLYVVSIIFTPSCKEVRKVDSVDDRLSFARECFSEIPYLNLDSMTITEETSYYYISDKYEVADWYYYDEVIFYLWSKSCFVESLNHNLTDSVCFFLFHKGKKIERRDLVENIHGYARIRFSSQEYYKFIETILADESYRDDLIILAHIYGKEITEPAKIGEIYYENFLVFLLQMSFKCKKNKLLGSEKLILRHLHDQAKSNHNTKNITKYFPDVIPCIY